MTVKVFKKLTQRKKNVLKLRFGVGDGSEHTLEEISQDFALSRERNRQFLAKALRTLRALLEELSEPKRKKPKKGTIQ